MWISLWYGKSMFLFYFYYYYYESKFIIRLLLAAVKTVWIRTCENVCWCIPGCSHDVGVSVRHCCGWQRHSLLQVLVPTFFLLFFFSPNHSTGFGWFSPGGEFPCWQQCCGSKTFWYGSGSKSGSSDQCLWPVDLDPAVLVLGLQDSYKKLFFFLFITFWRYIYIIFLRYKVIKKSENRRNQGSSYYFCLMIEGFGSVPLTNGSGSRRPKNIWIRIHNTLGKILYQPSKKPSYGCEMIHSLTALSVRKCAKSCNVDTAYVFTSLLAYIQNLCKICKSGVTVHVLEP